MGSSPAACGPSRSNLGPVALSLHPGPGLTEPSILSGSVNEYRLRLGRYKAGIATLLGGRNVPKRLCGGIVYNSYNKCSHLPLRVRLWNKNLCL